jgi:hypothetical protein
MKTILAAFLCAAALGVATAHADRPQISKIEVTASSTLKPKSDKYAPWRAVDFDAQMVQDDPDNPDMMNMIRTTGWCEGKKDQGVGEYLDLTPVDGTMRLAGVAIHAGFQKSKKLFAANNRPTRLTVTFTDAQGREQQADLTVPDGMTAGIVSLERALDVQKVRITFAEVTRGKVNDTCLSHVALLTDQGPAPAYTGDDGGIGMIEIALGNLYTGLESCDASMLKTAIKFPLAYASKNAKGKRVKKKLKNAKALAALCKKGQGPSPIEVDWTSLAPAGKNKITIAQAGDAGGDVWTLVYVSAGDAAPGDWYLTAVDYY